jgi:hypothetical protein
MRAPAAGIDQEWWKHHCVMKTSFFLIVLLLLAAAVAQENDEPRPKGVIYGIAIDQNGRPAMGIGLSTYPLGNVIFAGILPHVRTNNAGQFRFANLDWGRYTVHAEDESAGYSRVTTSPPDGHPSEVEITPEHREAEFNVYLPPQAGFLEIQLTNRRTGIAISGMKVAVMPMENPWSPLFTMSCYSDHVILIPPDKNILLHVSSDGFREWDESVGRGKPLQLPSGTRLTLAVQLEPSD